MSNRFVAACVVAVLVLLAPLPVHADPTGVLHFRSAVTIRTAAGNEVAATPGYYLTNATWDLLDVEVRRLQDRETQLDAENKQLRLSADTWQPGWRTLVSVALAGVLSGLFIRSQL